MKITTLIWALLACLWTMVWTLPLPAKELRIGSINGKSSTTQLIREKRTGRGGGKACLVCEYATTEKYRNLCKSCSCLKYNYSSGRHKKIEKCQEKNCTGLNRRNCNYCRILCILNLGGIPEDRRKTLQNVLNQSVPLVESSGRRKCLSCNLQIPLGQRGHWCHNCNTMKIRYLKGVIKKRLISCPNKPCTEDESKVCSFCKLVRILKFGHIKETEKETLTNILKNCDPNFSIEQMQALQESAGAGGSSDVGPFHREYAQEYDHVAARQEYDQEAASAGGSSDVGLFPPEHPQWQPYAGGSSDVGLFPPEHSQWQPYAGRFSDVGLFPPEHSVGFSSDVGNDEYWKKIHEYEKKLAEERARKKLAEERARGTLPPKKRYRYHDGDDNSGTGSHSRRKRQVKIDRKSGPVGPVARYVIGSGRQRK